MPQRLREIIQTTICLLCCSYSIISMGQEESLTEKFELPEAVKETSGLIFFNGKVITHNDSGDLANLYEIDTISGTISRTVNISNATHVDWEDIDQDDTYIYVGDFGNNSGDRLDLKVYRILKSDYINSTDITADVISFSYEDQTDFTTMPQATNFDAEAMMIYQDQIVVFTKNWIDQQTNAYIFPKIPGTYSAQKVSSFNSEGLITGASIFDEHILLTGYNTSAIPFLVFVDENRPSGFDLFGGTPQRIQLIGDIFLEQGSQIEGVCPLTFDRWYISREFASTTVGMTTFEFPQKLYEFRSFIFSLLSVNDPELSRNIRVLPNPVDDSFAIQQQNNPIEIQKMTLFNANGQEMKFIRNDASISLEKIPTGVYFLKIRFASGQHVIKKILKK